MPRNAIIRDTVKENAVTPPDSHAIGKHGRDARVRGNFIPGSPRFLGLFLTDWLRMDALLVPYIVGRGCRE
jgi:hypothetical protein